MIRGIFTWVMIFAFGFIIYLGPLALVLLVSTNTILISPRDRMYYACSVYMFTYFVHCTVQRQFSIITDSLHPDQMFS